MCLFSSPISSLKYLLNFFANFILEKFYSFNVCVLSAVYISLTQVFYQIYVFENIFTQWWFAFSFFIFRRQEIFNFDDIKLIHFYFIYYAFGCKNSLCNPSHKSLYYIFFLSVFIMKVCWILLNTFCVK